MVHYFRRESALLDFLFSLFEFELLFDLAELRLFLDLFLLYAREKGFAVGFDLRGRDLGSVQGLRGLPVWRDLKLLGLPWGSQSDWLKQSLRNRRYLSRRGGLPARFCSPWGCQGVPFLFPNHLSDLGIEYLYFFMGWWRLCTLRRASMSLRHLEKGLASPCLLVAVVVLA